MSIITTGEHLVEDVRDYCFYLKSTGQMFHEVERKYDPDDYRPEYPHE